MKNYWRALLIQLLCIGYDLHDVGTARTGTCRRCHQLIDQNGDAIR